MALSGFMPTVDGFDLDLDRAGGLPVAIGHGTRDPVISVDFARSARERLEQAGSDLTYQESDMGHQIDPRFLATLPGWVSRALP
jgi:phospholipase/carboxylesterase